MALVNIATILADTQRVLKKIKPPGGIGLLSYKRNRTFAIIKKDTDRLELREHGYRDQEFELPAEQLAKELKTMIKREFPRSKKILLVKFSTPLELERVRQKI
jgi:hypothetical protein